jgi:hypothetical protein
MPNKFAWFLTLAVFSGLSMNLILRFGIGLQCVAPDGDSRDFGKNAKWAFLVWPGIYFISIMLLWLFFSLLQSVLFLGFLEYILVFPVSSLFFTVVEYLVRRLVFTTNWRGETVSRNHFISDHFFIGGLMTGADQASLKSGVSLKNDVSLKSGVSLKSDVLLKSGVSLNSNVTPNGVFTGMVGGAPVGGALVGGAPVGGAPVGAALFIILGLAGSFAEAVMLSFGFSASTALAVLIIGEIRRRSAMEAVPDWLRGDPLILVAMGLLSLVFISAALVFYAVLGVN